MTEKFADLLDETMGKKAVLEGTVVKGTVILVEKDAAIIDAGLKSEGRVDLSEFGKDADIKVGDEVEVYLERLENINGEIVFSREKAKKEETWKELADKYIAKTRVEGMITGRVKGGFAVDINGLITFLPGSQVDTRPIRDVSPLMEEAQTFEIIKMDKERGNIVVSRKAVLEEHTAADREKILSTIKEGDIVEGIVKNITDYGAFVDLGGVDGLLHVTDISWKRISSPSEKLTIGETIKTKVIKFDQETRRISLGMKQIGEDPWVLAKDSLEIGKRFVGKVTNITDYGAFVEIQDGIEGLVHVSEMSWTKKNLHPGRIVSTSQEVEVEIIALDLKKRHVSLGIKQCQENPWDAILDNFSVGSIIEGEIKNVTEFGMFIGITDDIDGMIHMSDISWDVQGEDAIKEYNKGQVIRAKILDIDVAKERIALGIKQQVSDINAEALSGIKKGDIMTATIKSITPNGFEIVVADDIQGFIKKRDISSDPAEQRVDRYAVDEKVDGKIVGLNIREKKVNLSIRAYEEDQEKEAMKQYGSTDSGATLGDILGKALDDDKK